MLNYTRTTIICGSLVAFYALPAGAASESACRNYANRAVQQYQTMTTHSKCRVRTNARWQPNYENHHGWCLKAPVAWLRSEQKVRDDHLYRCGGQVRID
jgi:hypothetical protein